MNGTTNPRSSRANDMEHVHRQGGYALIRLNAQSLPLFNDGRPFDLEENLSLVKNSGQIKALGLEIQGKSWPIPVRPCVIRKGEREIRKAHKKLRRRASEKQTALKPETLEYAKFFMLVTTLPESEWSVEITLDLY
ncbi:MAG: hypothetical protein HQL83_05950 [Magnetococcales bacterium]|nr:hypothetical protein [Magnetococcales bacterium]